MRVYVSGSSREMDRAKAAIAAPRAHGVDVHDWTADFDSPPRDRAQLLDVLRLDLIEVRRCDLFLFLEPATPSIGAWVELGYTGGHKRLVVAGPSAPSEWPHALGVERAFALDVLAIEYVIAQAKARPA